LSAFFEPGPWGLGFFLSLNLVKNMDETEFTDSVSDFTGCLAVGEYVNG
jgi:hypothetical protein